MSCCGEPAARCNCSDARQGNLACPAAASAACKTSHAQHRDRQRPRHCNLQTGNVIEDLGGPDCRPRRARPCRRSGPLPTAEPATSPPPGERRNAHSTLRDAHVERQPGLLAALCLLKQLWPHGTTHEYAMSGSTPQRRRECCRRARRCSSRGAEVGKDGEAAERPSTTKNELERLACKGVQAHGTPQRADGSCTHATTTPRQQQPTWWSQRQS